MIIQKTYLNNSKFRYSIAIGNFDGIHVGHRFLLKKLCDLKKKELDKVGVLTFHPHPVKVIYPEKWKKNLIRFRTKFRLLKKNGLDAIFIISFNNELRNLSAKDFIEKVLIEGIKAKNILVGEDFKFGKNREGGIKQLLKYANEKKFSLFFFKKRKLNGEIYSSSAIRNYLKVGDIEKCNSLLGYKWEVEGRVVRGESRGRLLGYPTANINYNYQIAPSNGVYACWVKIDREDTWRMAAISTGTRPHYKGEEKILEVHLMEFSGNLYEKRIRVAFVIKIRNEEIFKSEDELIQRMKKDCENAKKILRKDFINNDNEG